MRPLVAFVVISYAEIRSNPPHLSPSVFRRQGVSHSEEGTFGPLRSNSGSTPHQHLGHGAEQEGMGGNHRARVEQVRELPRELPRG